MSITISERVELAAQIREKLELALAPCAVRIDDRHRRSNERHDLSFGDSSRRRIAGWNWVIAGFRSRK